MLQCPSPSPLGSAVSPSSTTYWSRTVCCLLSHVVWMSSLVTTLQYCRFVCTGSYVMLCHVKLCYVVSSGCVMSYQVVLCYIIRLCQVVSCCVYCVREKVSVMLLILFSQDTLEVFAESAQSSYGCLLINNRICVATQSW